MEKKSLCRSGNATNVSDCPINDVSDEAAFSFGIFCNLCGTEAFFVVFIKVRIINSRFTHFPTISDYVKKNKTPENRFTTIYMVHVIYMVHRPI